MTRHLTRYRIIAYIMDFVGIIFIGIHRAGYSPKIAASYQAPDALLYLGIALIIGGTAMVMYDMKKNTNSQAKKQDELG